MTEKESAIKVIEALPGSATMREIMYELYVRSVLQRSLSQLESGQTIPHEDIKKEIALWLKQ